MSKRVSKRKLPVSSADLEALVEERTRELAALNQALAIAKEEALAASKLKSDFMADMSHEIRTPMNGIIATCNSMLRTDLSEQQLEYANSIKEASSILLSLLNDILDFNKIEAGKIELESSEFDLVRIVEGACQILAANARSKELSLVSFIDPSAPIRLVGDGERVRQVLINLISNAIKFTDKGEIAVRAVVKSRQAASATIEFSVVDSGIGLSPEEQCRLFQPYVQADGTISNRFGGTGLGLCISKRLVSLMNGTIALKSKKGEGCTFSFEIPFETISGSHCDIKTTRQDVRVLIIDDKPNNREILHTYFDSWGMRNDTSSSADTGMRVLQQGYVDGDPYTVAIVEQSMAGKDGMEMAKEILGDPVLKTTKLILLTANDTVALNTQAMKLGFKACINNPIRQAQMLDCLLRVIEGSNSPNTKSPLDQECDTTGSPSNLKSELILIVEDHPMNQQAARLYLEELGFSSHIVSNGEEALKALIDNQYALILMDCQMPTMDGFAATALIRKAEIATGLHTPIIAMTAYAMKGDQEKCIATGMDAYISKPVEPSELKAIIEKWIPSQRLLEV